MQWLGLGCNANDRPRIGGARIGLAFPYFAVEANAPELTGDHHALRVPQRGGNRLGAVRLFEPAGKALPLGRGITNIANIKASIRGVCLRREGQPRTD